MKRKVTDSKILRRSGKAVVEYCKLIGWRPETVVQVGVGVNHAEVDCMREAWPDVCIHGFEPHPKTFKNIKSTYPGVLIDVAVGDKNERVSLYTKSRHADGSSLFDHEQRNTKNTYDLVEVGVRTLDGLFDLAAGPFVLLWLDCEGSELAALKGGTRFIRDSVGLINVEMTGRPPSPAWCSPYEVHSWLMDHGFVHVWTHTTRVYSGQYDAIYVRVEMVDDSLRVW